MKWKRIKGNVCEYSTGYVSLRRYISMSHTTHSNHYWYTYIVNGDEMFHGHFDAKNWDEAERIAVLRVRRELSEKANKWNKMLSDFDKEMGASEALD